MAVCAALLEQGEELASAGRLLCLCSLSKDKPLFVLLQFYPLAECLSGTDKEVLQPVVIQLQHVGRDLRR